MEVVYLKETITMEDVERLNKELPKVIEIPNTKKQDIEVLLKLDPRIRIRLVGNKYKEDGKSKEITKDSGVKDTYSNEELAAVINKFKEIEGGINPVWSDLEAALYTYIELIKNIEHADEQKLEDVREGYKNLLALAKGVALPEGFARVFQEAMNRIGVPCRTLDNGEGYAWNEIEIDGTYYPLDLAADSKSYRSEKSQGEIGISKFLTDKEFYEDPIHKTKDLSEEELAKIRAMDPSVVSKAREVISDKKVYEPRPVIDVKSKALSEIFKGGQLSEESILEISEVKISLQDGDIESLRSDIAEIGKIYPEVLTNIELENTTGASVKMQEVVDEIYTTRKALGQTDLDPISITISSSFAEDFDIDFSNAPVVENSTNTPVDDSRRSRVVFRNLSTSPVKIPSLNGKISPNIHEIEVSGFDLQDLDISGSGLRKLRISSPMTENIASIKGFEELEAVEFNAVGQAAFNAALPTIVSSTSNIHDLTVRNADFHDRKILQELAVNPNLVRLTITSSRVNDIDGLEQFDGRIALLNLTENDITVPDLKRINAFWENNPYAEIEVQNNALILDAIRRATPISDESHALIMSHFYESGTYGNLDKTNALNAMLASYKNVPYLIKDAKVVRDELGITLNPVALERDDEIDTVDFDEPYLQGATLLLTIQQVERLIASGKTIPQDVRINIHDVTELTSQRIRDLQTEMSNRGMNISGVQIFDKDNDNRPTQIAPYTLSQYVYIRDTLDTLVSGIDVSEPELDKFAVIYQRLMDSITYDTPACEYDTRDKAMYYAEKINPSRNLLEGLEEGQCVCAGYADILRNALLLVGVENRINSGICDTSTGASGHAWNQIRLDDGTGTKRWYYTDLTWDAGRGNNDWTLLGENNFRSKTYMRSVGSGITHDRTRTRNIALVEQNDYDRAAVREAFARARGRSFDFRNAPEIDIPEDPQMEVEILDQNRIAAEYLRRKNDMLAKYYGDEIYEDEYLERSERYYDHEIEVTDRNGITYLTIEDYPERTQDEEFLLLDKYRESLERMSRYEAGDTSVYTGTQDQIDAALERDRQYVETRNHTFNQHEHTQRDLATLGKYGERVPYIPRQDGILKNIGRGVLNVGIFARNLVAPIYRGIGRFVAQPIHRLITRGRDASPYKNNFYHRMVARREYFEERNRTQYPDQRIRNFFKSRVQAIFKSREGNEAVLKAGAADIRENILHQERSKVLVQNLTRRAARFDAQIRALETELVNHPNARNSADVIDAIDRKRAEMNRILSLRDFYRDNEIGTEQTDAISDRQHAIASKEVNTMRVSVIKGVAKGVAVKYIGPKIHDWLLERGKVTRQVEVVTEVPETKQRWVDPTYKTETVPIYEEGLDTSRSMGDIMSANGGKEVTGFYSVYGGERRPNTYMLSGDEKITAIFQARGNGGLGLSDTSGLRAPVLTNGTFDADLLTGSGVLNQDTTLAELVAGLNSGAITPEMLDNLYVSVGDRYWTKLSPLLEGMTDKIQVGEKIVTVLDVPGHMEEYVEMVEKVIQTTEVVNNPVVEKVVNASGKVVIGTMKAGGIIDVAENLRPTDSEIATNKRQPRRYNNNIDTDNMPKSKWEYER